MSVGNITLRKTAYGRALGIYFYNVKEEG